eukprot:TRINITY_DN7902_c0_g1_i3.p1 TRINITY_DN7902_c0_g1~~TRINITY_DN7902_c0_g1_i3.p1  ORF type:complete len:1427 (-),score=137.21 TRINITY_DN7902_c0_g1_i3:254-4534(-)
MLGDDKQFQLDILTTILEVFNSSIKTQQLQQQLELAAITLLSKMKNLGQNIDQLFVQNDGLNLSLLLRLMEKQATRTLIQITVSRADERQVQIRQLESVIQSFINLAKSGEFVGDKIFHMDQVWSFVWGALYLEDHQLRIVVLDFIVIALGSPCAKSQASTRIESLPNVYFVLIEGISSDFLPLQLSVLRFLIEIVSTSEAQTEIFKKSFWEQFVPLLLKECVVNNEILHCGIKLLNSIIQLELIEVQTIVPIIMLNEQFISTLINSFNNENNSYFNIVISFIAGLCDDHRISNIFVLKGFLLILINQLYVSCERNYEKIGIVDYFPEIAKLMGQLIVGCQLTSETKTQIQSFVRVVIQILLEFQCENENQNNNYKQKGRICACLWDLLINTGVQNNNNFSSNQSCKQYFQTCLCEKENLAILLQIATNFASSFDTRCIVISLIQKLLQQNMQFMEILIEVLSLEAVEKLLSLVNTDYQHYLEEFLSFVIRNNQQFTQMILMSQYNLIIQNLPQVSLALREIGSQGEAAHFQQNIQECDISTQFELQPQQTQQLQQQQFLLNPSINFSLNEVYSTPISLSFLPQIYPLQLNINEQQQQLTNEINVQDFENYNKYLVNQSNTNPNLSNDIKFNQQVVKEQLLVQNTYVNNETYNDTNNHQQTTQNTQYPQPQHLEVEVDSRCQNQLSYSSESENFYVQESDNKNIVASSEHSHISANNNLGVASEESGQQARQSTQYSDFLRGQKSGPRKFDDWWEQVIIAVTEEDQGTQYRMSQLDPKFVSTVAKGMTQRELLPEEHHIASMFLQTLAMKSLQVPSIQLQFLHDEVFEYMNLILGPKSPFPLAKIQICKAVSAITYGGKNNEVHFDQAFKIGERIRKSKLLQLLLDLFAEFNVAKKQPPQSDDNSSDLFSGDSNEFIKTIVEIFRNLSFLQNASTTYIIEHFEKRHYQQLMRIFQRGNIEDRKIVLQFTHTIAQRAYPEQGFGDQAVVSTFIEGLIDNQFPQILILGAQTGDVDLLPRSVNQMRILSQINQRFAKALVLTGVAEVLLLIITAMLSYASPVKARDYCKNYDMENQSPSAAAQKLAQHNHKEKISFANVCAGCFNQIAIAMNKCCKVEQILELLVSQDIQKQEQACLYLSLKGFELTTFKSVVIKNSKKHVDYMDTVISTFVQVLSSSQKWYVKCAILRMVYEWLVPESTDSQARGFTTELKQLIMPPIIKLLKRDNYANPGLHLMVLWSATFLVFNEPIIIFKFEKEGIFKKLLDVLINGTGISYQEDNVDDYYQAVCLIISNMLYNNQQILACSDVARTAKAICELLSRSTRLDCPRTVYQALYNITYFNPQNITKVRDVGAVPAIGKVAKVRTSGIEVCAKLLRQMCQNDQSGKTTKQVNSQKELLETLEQLVQSFPGSSVAKAVQRLQTMLQKQ